MSQLNIVKIASQAALTPIVFEDNNDVEIIQGCRVWVNFNGTGTVAIRDSFNVSSITDNGVGDYTINFTNALPSANYCASVGGRRSPSPVVDSTVSMAGTISTTQLRLFCGVGTGGANDHDHVCASIFANQ